MSARNTERVAGACFLLAFAFYGGGSSLVDSGSGTPAVLSRVVDHRTLIATGALLMLVNSLAAASIGVLLFPILKRRHEVSAYGYLICRSVEAVLYAMGAVFLLLLLPLGREYAASGGKVSDLPALARVVQEANHYSYEVGSIAVGLGGLVLCRVLLRERLVPRFLAVWGLVGYAVFVTGSVLEVLGYAVGTALSIPGGLFEVVLAVLLIARGFTGADSPEPDRPGLSDLDLRSGSAALSRVR